MTAPEDAAEHFAQSLPVMTIGEVPKCVTTEIADRDVSRTTPLQAICGLGVILFIGWCIFYAPSVIGGLAQ